MNKSELKSFLDEKYRQFNTTDFIGDDPVQLPHRFTDKRDIEIAGFFAAILAWGNRKNIINSCNRLMDIMGGNPYEFVINYNGIEADLADFKHRTFNAFDLHVFLLCLKKIYSKHKDLEAFFLWIINMGHADLASILSVFKREFLGEFLESRTQKHLSDPLKGSAAKRLCMYLRWMVRKDGFGVDLGIWTAVSSSLLKLPLDVHTSTIARKLGLLKRKQNDWKAVQEITSRLAEMDPKDPVKYDFALFGLGAIEGFGKPEPKPKMK